MPMESGFPGLWAIKSQRTTAKKKLHHLREERPFEEVFFRVVTKLSPLEKVY